MARNPDLPIEDNDRGPKHRHRIGDQLWYIHPNTDEHFLSVTSALETRAKEDLDHRWRPGLTAKAAINRLPELIRATITNPCGQTYGRCSRANTREHDWNVTCSMCPCKTCIPCLVKDLTYEHYRESKRATDRGSAVHDWIELWVRHQGDEQATWDFWRARCGTTVKDIEPWAAQIRPYTESFRQFVDDHGLTAGSWAMSEGTVLNRAHMWGGTLDGRIWFDATASKKSLELCERFGKERLLLSYDIKSREKEDASFHDDNALQLSAYRRGETVLLDDGSEEPLGPDDGAIVVQVRPDGYGLRPVVTDEATYTAFLGILAGARWAIEHGHASTLVRSFPRTPLPGVSPEPKPRKRANTAGKPSATRPATNPAKSKSTPRKAVNASVPKPPAPVVAPHTSAPRPAAPTTTVRAAVLEAEREPSLLEPPTRIRDIPKYQSAIHNSIRRATGPKQEPHPDSPCGDNIPF